MPSDLFDDHRAVVALAEELLAEVRRNPRPSAASLSGIRARLGQRAAIHLRSEDEVIIQPLVASGRAQELPGAQAAITAIRASRLRYSDHIRKWTPQAIEQDWNGYAAALVDMIAYLKQVIAQEEHDLYWPVLKLLHAQAQRAETEGPAPGTPETPPES